MEYRKFMKTGEDVSLLGVGTMRLPLLRNGEIDEAQAISMIRKAIDGGVNYVDTAYMYHGGKSEVVTGKALKDGYREKVFLADKMPAWYAKSEEDVRTLFEEQLKRLDVDCIDMYLVHNLTVPIWNIAKKHNVLPFLAEQRAQGKIKHIGFSFHDEIDFFKEVIDSYPWDFCQIQLNFMDAEFQAGVAGLKYAASKGIPVIVMEPLKGGKITDSIPSSIQEMWDGADIKRTPVEWAFKWVANFPEVMTILSGMSSMAQLEDNLRIFSDMKANSLTEKESEIIRNVSAQYNKLIQYSCTSCQYCMPCPFKLNIPSIISYYNDWFLFGENPKTREDYLTWNPPGKRASDCTDCKACESQCPQSLPISDIMKKAAAIFE
jgi:hypothetical protein